MAVKSRRRRNLEEQIAEALEPATPAKPATRDVDEPRPIPTPAELLEFERAHTRSGDRKGAETRRVFGVSLTRYVQLLRNALTTPEALDHDAQLVHQIQHRMNATRADRDLALGITPKEHR